MIEQLKTFITGELGIAIGIGLLKSLIVVVGALLLVAYATLAERKIWSWFQSRIGPNRVGPWGLLQPIADGIKFLMKEDIIPRNADKPLYILAPFLAMLPALLIFAVIPFGELRLGGYVLDLQIVEVNIGVLYIFALSSLGVYGIVLGGWASNNKYSLLGGLRAASQMISYELVLGLSIIGVVMTTGTLSLRGIVDWQQQRYILLLPQFLGFVCFLIAMVAELNRGPFDLPEAETELTGGYHTEYSSMKFAMFFMGEYAAMIGGSAIISCLFLGGGKAPFGWQLSFVPGPAWLFLKMMAFIFFFMWIKATFPRVRYDQLMSFGWKFLLPLALFNVLLTGVLISAGVL